MNTPPSPPGRKSTAGSPTIPYAQGEAPAIYAAGDVIAQKYELLELLGEGGMGAVWRAKNQTLDADVAIKLIRRDNASPEAAHRLLQEARATSRLEHPSIVRVFDFGETEKGDPFLVMELLRGESLGEALARRGRLPATIAVRTLLPVASALILAHDKGIIHRDLKPDNIYLTQDEHENLRPKIVDFGIAKFRADEPLAAKVTRAGTIVGSPDYMSPEQARGLTNVDERADVWAFCVVLYEVIAGRAPFTGSNYNMLLVSILEDEPPASTALGAGDEALWTILSRGLAKDPAVRWQDVRSLGRALAEWVVGHGVETDIAGASIRRTWLEEPKLTPRQISVPSLPGDLLETDPEASSGPISRGGPTLPSGVPNPSTTKTVSVRPIAPPAPPSRRKFSMLWLAVPIALGLAFAVYRPDRRRAAPLNSLGPGPVAPVSLASVPSARPSGSALASTPPVASLETCLLSRFPAASFDTDHPPDLTPTCTETDPRKGAASLKTEVVRASGGGRVTDAMREWAILGWYELPAFTAIRASCCPNAKPLVLPAPFGKCEPIELSLNDLAAAITSGSPTAPSLARFAAASRCTLQSGDTRYSYRSSQQGGEDVALEKTLARARGK